MQKVSFLFVNVLPNLILNGVCIGEPAWVRVAWAPIVFLQLFREQSLLLHEVLDHEACLLAIELSERDMASKKNNPMKKMKFEGVSNPRKDEMEYRAEETGA